MRSLNNVDTLLNPMKSAEARMCDIWKVAENQIEMTLSKKFQRLCFKPDKKFDDDDEEEGRPKMMQPLKQKFTSSDSVSNRIIKCLQAGQLPQGSYALSGPLAKAVIKPTQLDLSRELRRRQLFWRQVQATEALDSMTTLLKPERLASFSNLPELAMHVSSVAAALEVVQELLMPTTLFLFENWSIMKRGMRRNALGALRTEVLSKKAIDMDIFTNGLWSSSQVEEISKESQVHLEKKTLVFKRRNTETIMAPPRRAFVSSGRRQVARAQVNVQSREGNNFRIGRGAGNSTQVYPQQERGIFKVIFKELRHR